MFTRTKHGADKVVRGLNKDGIAAEAIHGNKSQNQRERALANFRNGRVRMLVATDIAARGIDVDGISHVINFDLPNMPESYVHRIGRTARAGADGIAISFCSHDELPYPARHREADPAWRSRRPARRRSRRARRISRSSTTAAMAANEPRRGTAATGQAAQRAGPRTGHHNGQTPAKQHSGRTDQARTTAPTPNRTRRPAPDRVDPADRRRFGSIAFMQPR